jgi:aminocarboxymuconate-semialdehyde decarboxylase
MQIVDVHAHGVPEALLAALAEHPDLLGAEVAREDDRIQVSVAGAAPFTVPGGLVRVADRLAAMDRAGVDVQLVSPWMNLAATAVGDEVAVDFARASNDAMADLVAAHPDRLVALANLPLQDPVGAAAELRRAVTDLGMVGAEIATRPGGRDLDAEAFEVLWRTAAELDCMVLVHPHRSLAGSGVSRHFLGNLVGNPAESTIAIGHLVFGGVVGRHPRVRFCLVHGGGFAPYQVGRWDHAYERNARGSAAGLERPPSELLRTMYFDTVLHSAAALEHLVGCVGEGQVVLGSDYPFEMGDPDPVGSVRGAAGLAEPVVDRVLGGNVGALLGAHAQRLRTAGRP